MNGKADVKITVSPVHLVNTVDVNATTPTVSKVI